MNTTYVNSAIRDVTATATAHELVGDHYKTLADAVRIPMAVGPVLVMIASFLGSVMGGDYYFYANEVLSLLSLLVVAVDTYYGWSKMSVSNANAAARFFELRDKLNHLKRVHLTKTQNIQPAVEKLEDTFLQLLHKYRRPPIVYQQRALEAMRSTLALTDSIDQRRHSESTSKTHTGTGVKSRAVSPPQPAPALVRAVSANELKTVHIAV